MNLTLLIDLDDTLLPNSTEKFIPPYLNGLSNHLSDLAPPQTIQEVLIKSTQIAMRNCDPAISIKQVFDQNFYSSLGTTAVEQEDSLLDFYTNKYPAFSPIETPEPHIVKFMDECFNKGYQVAIATNPIFPKIATYERLRWAGIPPERFPFSLVSTYEDFHFSKPFPAYLLELLSQIGWPENPVIVIGNDLQMDIMPAKEIGLATYWVDDDYTKLIPSSRHGRGPLDNFHSWLDVQKEEKISPDYSGFLTSLETLRATPASILTLLKDIQPQYWTLKSDQDSWSITEILCHLRDVDQEVHLSRFESLRDDPEPFLTAIDADAWADERVYNQQNGHQALHDFIENRKKMVKLVNSLPEDIEEKEIRHSIFGPTTLTEILKIAARHDKLHIQQLFTQIQST